MVAEEERCRARASQALDLALWAALAAWPGHSVLSLQASQAFPL